jgi:hypothetical protein
VIVPCSRTIPVISEKQVGKRKNPGIHRGRSSLYVT